MVHPAQTTVFADSGVHSVLTPFFFFFFLLHHHLLLPYLKNQLGELCVKVGRFSSLRPFAIKSHRGHTFIIMQSNCQIKILQEALIGLSVSGRMVRSIVRSFSICSLKACLENISEPRASACAFTQSFTHFPAEDILKLYPCARTHTH